MWFAGAGIKGGTVVGATDELGIKAAENVYHLPRSACHHPALPGIE